MNTSIRQFAIRHRESLVSMKVESDCDDTIKRAIEGSDISSDKTDWELGELVGDREFVSHEVATTVNGYKLKFNSFTGEWCVNCDVAGPFYVASYQEAFDDASKG